MYTEGENGGEQQILGEGFRLTGKAMATTKEDVKGELYRVQEKSGEINVWNTDYASCATNNLDVMMGTGSTFLRAHSD